MRLPKQIVPRYISVEAWQVNHLAIGQHLSLTLADLGSVGERVLHTMPDMARNFDSISVRPGHGRNLMCPYFAASCCDGIAEGQDCFSIPGTTARFRWRSRRRGWF